MKEIRIPKENYDRIVSGESAYAIVREASCDAEVGEVVRFLAVVDFYGSAVVTREAWKVVGRRDCSEEDGLRAGFVVLSLVRKEALPGDRESLSTRARNVLGRNGVDDARLSGMGIGDVLDLPGCGLRTADEIMRYRDTLFERA